jgi:hypothetical protein
MMQDKASKRPIKVFRCGAVKAAIWTNQRVMDNSVVEIYSVKIDKAYKEGDEWENTTTFAADDLPKVAMAATEAYRFLRLRSEEPSDSHNNIQSEDDRDVASGDLNRPANGSMRPLQ